MRPPQTTVSIPHKSCLPAQVSPSFAGNATSSRIRLPRCQVRPRLRGEYSVAPTQLKKELGSPPPPRGIQTYRFLGDSRKGFTPASAGNTYIYVFRNLTKQVHPRLRGEYHLILTVLTQIIGSPPPPRGIHSFLCQCCICQRFTPASAGNTVGYIGLV